LSRVIGGKVPGGILGGNIGGKAPFRGLSYLIILV